MEGNLLARRACIPQGLSRGYYASHRTLRHSHQALRADDPFVCQHDGRPRHYPLLHSHHLHRMVTQCCFGKWTYRAELRHDALHELP